MYNKKHFQYFFIGLLIVSTVLPSRISTLVNASTQELSIQNETTEDEKKFLELENKNRELKNERADTVSGKWGTSEFRIASDILYFGAGTLDNNSRPTIINTYASSIQKVVFEGEVIASPKSLKGFFRSMKLVSKIENLDYLDTSQATDMSGMFAFVSRLPSLDVSSFDTSQVTNMDSMFSSMSKLISLDVSNFDTSQVTNMDFMFSQMSSLISLDVSNFDTSQVTSMTNMFSHMTSLISLDISNFDTSQVTSMTNMFASSSVLQQLKLGSEFIFRGNEILSAIKPDTKYTGKWINVSTGTPEFPKGKNIWTSQELLENYRGSRDADTYVWEKNLQLEVKTKLADIPLGTNISDIDPNEFIESVKLGDVELSKDEYTIELKNSIKTTKIDNQNVELEVSLKNDSSKVTDVRAVANIVWGSTLIAKDSSFTEVNSSVSLLHKKEAPYLNANEGTGLAIGTLTTKPNFLLYRLEDKNPLFDISYSASTSTPVTFLQYLNTTFEGVELKYGDVLVMKNTKWGGNESWLGNNTFISRNNALVTETVGYDKAYYELTPSGYRLLRLNQLVVNNNQKVKLNTSKEEMNKNISNFISLPEQIENPNDFRMEFENVDTASSGNKKSTINVYETLESGGEFKTTYEVAYSINPEVTEFYYDVDGKQIEQSQTTEFEFGKEFTPNPEKYIENKGELYIYRGWVDTLPGTENIVPQEGVPEATKVEKSYYYVYDKADKFINVTLPTEVVFGTFENNNKISSKGYEIKNNSDELPVEVSLERFDKVKSDIKLLSLNTPDPTQEEASAKLNLYVDNKSVISGLTEDTPTQSITKIDTNTSRAISLEGTYFGNMSDKNILDYKMHLKFKATRDNKN